MATYKKFLNLHVNNVGNMRFVFDLRNPFDNFKAHEMQIIIYSKRH